MSEAAVHRPVIWFEVGDMLAHFAHSVSPSGIQRVVIECVRSAQQRGMACRLCRLDPLRGTLVALPDDWIERVLARPRPPARPPGSASVPPPVAVGSLELLRLGLRTLAKGGFLLAKALLPAGLRVRLKSRVVGDLQAPITSGLLVNRRQEDSAEVRLSPETGLVRLLGVDDPVMVRWLEELVLAGAPARPAAGDVVLALGGPWAIPGYCAVMDRVLDESRAVFAFMSYDLIPLTHPQHFPKGSGFVPWMEWALRRAAFATAISRYTREALLGELVRRALPAFPVTVVRLGSGIPVPDPPALAEAGLGRLADRPYVLFVSTVECRKNHLALFRAWQRLRTLHGAACPRLVLVGRKGWMVSDLFEQLEASDWLDGLVVHIDRAGDAQLAALYRAAWFTVYPSLVEGWGLPVEESLGYGRPCLASHAASIPEVGGDLAFYCDPDDITGLVAEVGRFIADPGLIERRAALIRERFRPTSWQACADGVLAAVEGWMAGGAGSGCSAPVAADAAPAAAAGARS